MYSGIFCADLFFKFDNTLLITTTTEATNSFFYLTEEVVREKHPVGPRGFQRQNSHGEGCGNKLKKEEIKMFFYGVCLWILPVSLYTLTEKLHR